MVITVRAVGTLMNHMPKLAETLTLSFVEPLSVANLIAHLNLPEYEIWLMTVNGEQVEPSQMLEDGDQLTLYAPVAGG